jgi:hypothetical protein
MKKPGEKLPLLLYRAALSCLKGENSTVKVNGFSAGRAIVNLTILKGRILLLDVLCVGLKMFFPLLMTNLKSNMFMNVSVSGAGV